MKPIYQTIFDDTYGDCFRACVASIFEFSIEEMPNFWEQTQDLNEFWQLNDEWLMKNRGFKCFHFQLPSKHKYLIKDLLCIACAKSLKRNEDEELSELVDHAVVWKNGLLHDPHPSEAGLAEDPDTFTVFVPIDPKSFIKKL